MDSGPGSSPTRGDLSFNAFFSQDEDNHPTTLRSSPHRQSDFPMRDVFDTPYGKFNDTNANRGSSHGMQYLISPAPQQLLAPRAFPSAKLHSRASSNNSASHSRASSNNPTTNRARTLSAQPTTIATSAIISMHNTPNPDGDSCHILTTDDSALADDPFTAFTSGDYDLGNFDEHANMSHGSQTKTSAANTPTRPHIAYGGVTPSSMHLSGPSSQSQSNPFVPANVPTTPFGINRSTKRTRETTRGTSSPFDSPTSRRRPNPNLELLTSAPLARAVSQTRTVSSESFATTGNRNVSGYSMASSISLETFNAAPPPTFSFNSTVPSMSLPDLAHGIQDPSPTFGNGSNIDTPQEALGPYVTSPDMLQVFSTIHSQTTTGVIDQSAYFESQAGSMPGSTVMQATSSFNGHRQTTLDTVVETPALSGGEMAMGYEQFMNQYHLAQPLQQLSQYPQQQQQSQYQQPQPAPGMTDDRSNFTFGQFMPSGQEFTHYPNVPGSSSNPVMNIQQWSHNIPHVNNTSTMMNNRVNVRPSAQPLQYATQSGSFPGHRSASMGTGYTPYIPGRSNMNGNGRQSFDGVSRPSLRVASDSQVNLGGGGMSGMMDNGAMSRVRVLPADMRTGGLFPLGPESGMGVQAGIGGGVGVGMGGDMMSRENSSGLNTGSSSMIRVGSGNAMSKVVSSEGMENAPPLPPYNIGHHQPQRRSTRGRSNTSSPATPSRRTYPTIGRRSKPGPKPKSKGLTPTRGAREETEASQPEAGPSFSLPYHGELAVQIGQGGMGSINPSMLLPPSSGSEGQRILETLQEDDESDLSGPSRVPTPRPTIEFGPALTEVEPGVDEWKPTETALRVPSPHNAQPGLHIPQHLLQTHGHLLPHPYNTISTQNQAQPLLRINPARAAPTGTLNPDGTISSGGGLPAQFIQSFYDPIISAFGRPDGVPVKQFRCKITGCERIVPRKSAITSHIQTHLEDKPFRCEFGDCDSAFVRSHDLRRHQKTHLGKKPYVCLCGKGFARGDALMRHRQRGICAGGLVKEGDEEKDGQDGEEGSRARVQGRAGSSQRSGSGRGGAWNVGMVEG